MIFFKKERDDSQIKLSYTFQFLVHFLYIAALSVPEAGLAAGSDALLLTVWS